MNGVSEPIVRWVEQERRAERTAAAVLSVLGLGGAAVAFLLISFLIYVLLTAVCAAFAHPGPWLVPAALGLTAGFFALSMKGRRDVLDVNLDPMGLWIIKDICSFGPRLMFEGMRQVRRCGELGELNVGACARALAYLAAHDAAVDWEELLRHGPQVSSERLRTDLALLHGVLFLGEDASRVILMEPFRLRLRSMLGREQRAGKGPEPARPRPESPPRAIPANEPEKLSAYELLGLSPLASMMQIKAAYRKRVKECHPDLFAGMDQQAQVLAERWTKALNAAYASLNPRNRGTRR